MTQKGRNYAVLNGFKFEFQPVGIKFLLNRPENLKQTEHSMPICRMLHQAQVEPPFYATKDNFTCVDKLVMGMAEPEPILTSGQIGAKEKIYQDARANRRIYQYIQKIPAGTVRYLAFASVDQLCFEPDLLVITAKPSDAEVLFRALSYSTGKPLASKTTPVLSCAWIFAYPYLSGEINFTVTGIGYGIRLQKTLPEGLFLISVPYDQIPMLIENLEQMDWVLPITTMNESQRTEYSAKIMDEIQQEYLSSMIH